MDKYKKWEDPPVLKNTIKCLFFSSLRLNWPPFAAHLLGNHTLGILFCVFVLNLFLHTNVLLCVCVEVFVSWEELVIKVPRWRRAIPCILSWWEFAPKLTHTWQEVTLITDCAIVFTHSSESCRSYSMPLWCVSLLGRNWKVCTS